MRIALAFAALLALAAPAAAQPWTLQRRVTPGSRARVEETTRTEYRARYQARGANVGDATLELWERRYVEEARAAQPETLHRAFELSQRDKRHPQAAPNPTQTSMHGRGVIVAGLEQRPDGPFELSKDDREATRFDRLAAAFLPERPIANARDRWDVAGSTLVRAVFGQYLNPAPESTGRAEVKSVRATGGKTHITLRVRGLLKTVRTDTLPEVSISLTGELRWCVEDGALLEGRLEGPVSYGMIGEEDGRRTEWTAEGTTTWTYRGEVLESRAPVSDAERRTGAPPPPGTRALVCEQHAEHRFDLGEFIRCIQCGAELDLTTRRCPQQHPWPLQYCPRDGAPLKPES
jgi:hypothetical protein